MNKKLHILMVMLIVFVGFKSWRSNTMMSSESQQRETAIINESPKPAKVTIFSATLPRTTVEINQQPTAWWQKRKSSAPVTIPFMVNEENILVIEQNGESNTYRVMMNPMDFNGNTKLIIKTQGNLVLHTESQGQINEQNIPVSRR